MEAYLQSIGINELHEYTIKNPHAASSFTLDESDNNPFNTSGTSIGEKLYWNRDEKRLYYVSLKFKAYLSSHTNSQEILISTDAPETTMKRPLIETPFDIRKDIYINNHLGSFLSEIAEKFKLNDVAFLNNVDFSDGCPF